MDESNRTERLVYVCNQISYHRLMAVRSECRSTRWLHTFLDAGVIEDLTPSVDGQMMWQQ